MQPVPLALTDLDLPVQHVSEFHFSFCFYPGHCHQDTPTVRDATVHHRHLTGFHAACRHSTQRHRFFFWKP